MRMVTGDNVNTATAIATKCGILDADSDYVVMEGKAFNAAVRDDQGKIIQDKVFVIVVVPVRWWLILWGDGVRTLQFMFVCLFTSS